MKFNRKQLAVGGGVLALIVMAVVARDGYRVYRHDYGGSCGRIRSCTTWWLGLKTVCGFEAVDEPLRAFAEERECGEWVRKVQRTRMPGSDTWESGPAEGALRAASAVVIAQQKWRAQNGSYTVVAIGDVLPGASPKCGASTYSAATFVTVFGLKEGVETERCWSVDHTGALRLLHSTTDSSRAE